MNQENEISDDLNILMYQKVQKCPLRSQIANVRDRAYQRVQDAKIMDKRPQAQKELIIQSFLNEHAV